MRKISKILIGFIVLCIIIMGLGSTSLFTPALDKEVNYFKKMGYKINESKTWEEYKAEKESGPFEVQIIQVSKEQFRDEVAKEMEAFGEPGEVGCDRDVGILWIWGVGPKTDVIYLYWCKP